MIKLIKWLSHKMGYKIIMLKASKGTTTIEGDKELLKYVDITGYFFKKEPLSRIKPSKAPTSAQEMWVVEPKFDDEGTLLSYNIVKPDLDVTNIKPITKLTPEQLKELGLTINVDVTDCKNFKEASKVQEQIINGDVKINVIKNKS